MHCSEVGSCVRRRLPLRPHRVYRRARCQVGRQWGRGGDGDTCGVFFEQQKRSKNIQGHTEEMGTRLINLSQQLLRLTGIENLGIRRGLCEVKSPLARALLENCRLFPTGTLPVVET